MPEIDEESGVLYCYDCYRLLRHCNCHDAPCPDCGCWPCDCQSNDAEPYHDDPEFWDGRWDWDEGM